MTMRGDAYLRQFRSDLKEQGSSYAYELMVEVLKLTEVSREVKIKGGS
jgi:hypothetical protein